MFDIGFFEILVIGIVGLFVIGPERLPGAIKNVALWVSRIKRSLLDTRKEFEEQIGADEIRREIYNEQVMHNLDKLKDTRAELEQKLNDWKDDALADENSIEHKPDELEEDNSNSLEYTESDEYLEEYPEDFQEDYQDDYQDKYQDDTTSEPGTDDTPEQDPSTQK